jgi:Ser-tRNA(Ala) deacylase AlaX
MTVAKVFWTEPYRTELEAVVTGVEGDTITLDQTIFFAFSGGQESDTGTILLEGRPVTERNPEKTTANCTQGQGEALRLRVTYPR